MSSPNVQLACRHTKPLIRPMDSTPSLVVLFGHENDRDGESGLSRAAKLRCEAAARLYASWPPPHSPHLLITGAFGDHFNRTPRPHHQLMRDHFLAQLAITPGVVVPAITGAPTSFTIEDIAYVRRFALTHGHTRIRLVTSKFHLPRVAFLARKLLPEFSIDYTEARDPDDLRPEALDRERKSLAELESGGEWADVPLPDAKYVFPAETYKNAFEEHKHDDTVSYWLIAGALTALTAAHVHKLDPGHEKDAGLLLIASAIAGFLIWKLYLRYACFAKIARVSMRLIETVYFAPGFSYNHRKYRAKYGLDDLPASRQVMRVVIGLLIALNLYKGLKLLGCNLLP